MDRGRGEDESISRERGLSNKPTGRQVGSSLIPASAADREGGWTMRFSSLRRRKLSVRLLFLLGPHSHTRCRADKSPRRGLVGCRPQECDLSLRVMREIEPVDLIARHEQTCEIPRADIKITVATVQHQKVSFSTKISFLCISVCFDTFFAN
ncbi:unnamed protein product, partial [Heterotrigona itama]